MTKAAVSDCGIEFISALHGFSNSLLTVARSRRHLPAFFGTAAARLRTPPTVLGLVLRALDRTLVARLGTDPADRRRQGRTPAHGTGARPAQRRTVAAGADTSGHFRVPDAGIPAVLTRLCTSHTCFDAASILLVCHATLSLGCGDRAGCRPKSTGPSRTIHANGTPPFSHGLSKSMQIGNVNCTRRTALLAIPPSDVCESLHMTSHS